MKRTISNWRLGLFIGLLMFVVGLGGGIYSFEWLKSETNIGNLENAWFVLAMFGLAFCAVLVIWGLLLSIASLKRLQNANKRRTVGWAFFISGVGGAIYLLQYLALGILPWWDHETIYGSEGFIINFGVGIAIGIEYLASLVFCGIIVWAGWRISHIHEGLQPTPQPPDEPVEG